MAMNYARIQDRVEQILQDTTNATYGTTELGMWIEDALKEFSPYDPHIVLVTFKIEARTGTATSYSANNLVDATNDQFLATDDDNEKVVYNTTDKTWAVITSIPEDEDGDTVGLSANIMAEGEGYKIFNKHCYNNKQIYIGDVGDYLWIDKVEYKCNKSPRSWRNWKLYGNVLEIDIDFTPTDTDEVNVYFARPHKLCQLRSWAGALTAAALAGVTTIAVDGLGKNDVVEVGDEFYIVGHRSLYTITIAFTLSGDGAGTITGFSPSLEAVAAENDVINFTKSTLKPHHEELFCHLVAARAVLSEANAQLIQAKADMTTGRALVNTVNLGGTGATVANAYLNYARAEEELAREQRTMGERKLGEVISKLERLSPPRTSRVYPKD